ncbi:hypothetical protein [Terribacillus halophilus]|uniref:hypothetical protein n=1 Tax=Terribacillus halophilus TaxID=361279 RepID=UPI000986CA85|nr:hypothetical protein [Terribacillus halophilus]
MTYIAKLIKLNPHIEEEVTLKINDVEFTAFAFVCPYPIELGRSYPISIGFTILDELNIHELNENRKEIVRLDSSYEYLIRGLLQRNSLDAGIIINDEDEYFSDYPNLIGKQVEIKVDRISVEFLQENKIDS